MIAEKPSRRNLLAGLAASGFSTAANAVVQVDLALVLAIDCSYSVDAYEYQLQLRGTGQAFLSKMVLEAIARGPNKRIAVSVFLWSEPAIQYVLLPWQILATVQDAHAMADVLLRAPRDVPRGTTATGSALLFAQSMLETAPSAFRRVIDISTDGTCNEGPDVSAVRDAIVAQGTTINGLAITVDVKDLADYVQTNVIGGNQSFVVTADDFEAYGQALRQKLFREITNVDLI